jgi:hypothetical protein
MSENTPCNYCTLKSMKRRCPKDMKIVLIGNTAYRVPKGMKKSEMMTWNRNDRIAKKYFVAWFMELPYSCCC